MWCEVFSSKVDLSTAFLEQGTGWPEHRYGRGVVCFDDLCYLDTSMQTSNTTVVKTQSVHGSLGFAPSPSESDPALRLASQEPTWSCVRLIAIFAVYLGLHRPLSDAGLQVAAFVRIDVILPAATDDKIILVASGGGELLVCRDCGDFPFKLLWRNLVAYSCRMV